MPPIRLAQSAYRLQRYGLWPVRYVLAFQAARIHVRLDIFANCMI